MIELREFLSQVVIIITATILFYVAINDLREYRIRNEYVITIACLYGIYAFLSGEWVYAHWNIALALLMFIVLLIFYTQNWLGGGDVKILTVGFLWAGQRYAMPFSLLLLIFSFIHVYAAKFGLVGARYIDGKLRLAFAPSVAGALIGMFVLRWSGALNNFP
jgi:Flp pilus assembly protein protease CpaA